ncbi:MAG: hypothetical protein LBK50_01400 [Candidatus Nomurabacteria bacterium]|nr:hypothetical protein [Candidatus Nomurabacteria bacterium]
MKTKFVQKLPWGGGGIICLLLLLALLTSLIHKTTNATDSVTLTINHEKTLTLSPNTCTPFSLDTITSTTQSLGYGISVYLRTNTAGSNLTITQNSNTVPADSNNPLTIIDIDTITATNELKTTEYEACTNNAIANGQHNVTVAYILKAYPRTCIPSSQFRGDVGTLQNIDVTDWNIGDSGIATDIRNNQEYCIGKLKDNKTWMLDNLKFELTDGMTLTSEYTDVVKDTTVYFTQDGSESGTPLPNRTNNFTTSGYMTRDGRGTYVDNNSDVWGQYDPAISASRTDYCQYPYGEAYIATDGSRTGCGYLYNFWAASASTAGSRSSGNANASICPAGWRLPTGGASGGEFAVLDQAYGGTGGNGQYNTKNITILWLSSGAWRGVLATYMTNNGGGIGEVGHYWTSTLHSGWYTYAPYIVQSSRTSFTPNTYSYWHDGIAVRCLVR